VTCMHVENSSSEDDEANENTQKSVFDITRCDVYPLEAILGDVCSL
jgi:hypothetical protein